MDQICSTPSAATGWRGGEGARLRAVDRAPLMQAPLPTATDPSPHQRGTRRGRCPRRVDRADDPTVQRRLIQIAHAEQRSLRAFRPFHRPGCRLREEDVGEGARADPRHGVVFTDIASHVENKEESANYPFGATSSTFGTGGVLRFSAPQSFDKRDAAVKQVTETFIDDHLT